MNTVAPKTIKDSQIDTSKIVAGDVFYESSHYTFIGNKGNDLQFKHLKTGEIVNLSKEYVQEMLITADQYFIEVKVGKENKMYTKKDVLDPLCPNDVKEGDLKQKGIRTIFSEITTDCVFFVAFRKKDEELSAKAMKEKREVQLQEVISAIGSAKASKKSVEKAACDAVKKIQENPVISITKGELRELRGYKVEFFPVDGMYNVIDMDIITGSPQRQVNINTIEWLVYKGIKYILE